MNVAEYILARLEQARVEDVFTVPGDYAGKFMAALDKASGIRRVATINELGAGYAADGYGRMRGVGAACVQYGVGTFSVLNCVAGSFVERVPVVVISASPKTGDQKLEIEQKILFHHSTGDLQANKVVFENVTVASEIISDKNTAASQIDGAFSAMLTHRRPIYIEVLADVWDQECGDPQPALEPSDLPLDQSSLEAAVEEAWQRIAAAELPVIWAGVEVQRFGLQDLLQKLVDVSGMPFTTTSLGKTVLDEAQKQFIGTFAGPASPALTRAVMAATDCPVALGTIITDDYLEIMSKSYDKMIEVNDEQARVGTRQYQQVPLKAFLARLVDRYEQAGEGPRRYTLPDPPPDPTVVPTSTDPLTYEVFYEELTTFLRQEGMTDEVVLALGESTSLYVFGNVLGLPRDSFVSQAAWGSLGHETGCALGIALGTGKRPFVVAGDGGFRMVCQELSSLATQKCNAVVFVMSNNVYAIEQAFVGPEAFKPGGEFAPFDVLEPWDYLALAKAFGATGYRAGTVDELRMVLKDVKGLEHAPALVEIVVPTRDFPPQLARLAGVPPALQKLYRDD
jgi:indolepyruvate decarboxylase